MNAASVAAVSTIMDNPKPRANNPAPICSPRLAQVRVFAVNDNGTAMTTENAAMPMTEPIPNSAMNTKPLAALGAVEAVSATSAADPASPCIMPTLKLRRQLLSV